jgi:predicted nucleic-acid-binding protein
MIGLDTTVLVRYIVQDDPEQSEQATRTIEEHCTVKQPGFINRIVLVELVWVLKGAYGYDKTIIESVLQQILTTAELVVEKSDVAWHALQALQKGTADFADYLIASVNKRHGCQTTVTFDRNAAKNKYVQLLD